MTGALPPEPARPRCSRPSPRAGPGGSDAGGRRGAGRAGRPCEGLAAGDGFCNLFVTVCLNSRGPFGAPGLRRNVALRPRRLFARPRGARPRREADAGPRRRGHADVGGDQAPEGRDKPLYLELHRDRARRGGGGGEAGAGKGRRAGEEEAAAGRVGGAGASPPDRPSGNPAVVRRRHTGCTKLDLDQSRMEKKIPVRAALFNPSIERASAGAPPAGPHRCEACRRRRMCMKMLTTSR